MKIVSVGGGPAGLYFAILMKQADPRNEVIVYERNQPDDTFGFGVVFSDATLAGFAEADRPSYDAVTQRFAHWDNVDIHYRGQVITSTGHGFSGMSRQGLLDIFQARCRALGVVLHFGADITELGQLPEADLILGADGLNSTVRAAHEDHFQPQIDLRPNKFVWLGTSCPYGAFTFYFGENEHGMFRVHAYRYEEGSSTFIVECTAETFHNSGLGNATEEQTVAYMEELFAEQLQGHKLLKNKSIWRNFPTVRNARWTKDNIVLMGDAAHTAHYSIGSGTKLAMEDAVELRAALQTNSDLTTALQSYEQNRRPVVDSIQRAAQVSLEWFETTERYLQLPPIQFAASLLTRSLRITHDNLKLRDPAFGAEVERWYAATAAEQSGCATTETTPPMFTPYRLRDLVLPNRIVVSPMCMYSATDGTVSDWHLVHLGSRAVGGAGLVLAEMTDVAADGRITPGCAGLYRDEHITAWRRITQFVHDHSEAKIGVQLGHAGRKGSCQKLWEQPDQPLPTGNWPLLAPSAIPYGPASQVPIAMDRAAMDRVRDEFVRAAERADAAGFDLLELHCAHGYLLASFISPLTNHRDDDYGGSLDNRMRYPLEVFDAVRAAWPAAKPMSVRISACDWNKGGTTGEDAVQIAKLFSEHGCDIIDVSTGQTVADQRPEYGRLYQTPFADRVRHEAGVPTMTVGNIKSYEDCNSILAAGRADLVVMARAHLHDPYLARHAAQAADFDLPWPVQYQSVTGFEMR